MRHFINSWSGALVDFPTGCSLIQQLWNWKQTLIAHLYHVHPQATNLKFHLRQNAHGKTDAAISNSYLSFCDTLRQQCPTSEVYWHSILSTENQQSVSLEVRVAGGRRERLVKRGILRKFLKKYTKNSLARYITLNIWRTLSSVGLCYTANSNLKLYGTLITRMKWALQMEFILKSENP